MSVSDFGKVPKALQVSVLEAIGQSTSGTSGNILASGNVKGSTLTGTLTTASQPNVTTLVGVTSLNSITVGSGTLSGLSSVATTALTVNGVAVTGGGGITLDVQQFETPGTFSAGDGWQKPSGKSLTMVVCFGGGGQGGGGSSGTNGAVRGQGCGGGGGAGIRNIYPTALLASQETVIVGSGGSGTGAGGGTGGADGTDGTSGGNSSFGSWITAGGGGGGSRGVATAANRSGGSGGGAFGVGAVGGASGALGGGIGANLSTNSGLSMAGAPTSQGFAGGPAEYGGSGGGGCATAGTQKNGGTSMFGAAGGGSGGSGGSAATAGGEGGGTRTWIVLTPGGGGGRWW